MKFALRDGVDTPRLRFDSNFKTAYIPGNLIKTPRTAEQWRQKNWGRGLTALMRINAILN
ncbi:MAG: hypothetical protein P4L96_23420 [Rhodoferax sp.]|nr:hypothetical protein [Rhodoferax sp.]